MSGGLLHFRREVPEDVREEMKAKLLQASVEGLDEYIEVTQYIMAELVAGNIGTDVAQECRALLELMMTAIVARSIERKKGGTSQSEVAEALRKAKRERKMLAPQVNLDGYGDRNGTEVILVEVSREREGA